MKPGDVFYYADEFNVSWLPTLRAMWSPVGQQVMIPTPGQPKKRTTIGRNVRTGVQNAFIAPVEIGDGAWIGAGSVITRDVPPGALGIARARQENKEGYAARGTDQSEGTSDDD